MCGHLRGAVILILLSTGVILSAQRMDSLTRVTGIVYDRSFKPVPATHVVNLNTRSGVVTDSLGIFSIAAGISDTLLIRNIAFRDTIITARQVLERTHIMLNQMVYPINEVRIFNWGSTYNDFRDAVVDMGNISSLGERMGLPRQDPDYIPFDMDGSRLRKPAFLLTSPVSYFYYNFNKKAISARKVYWLQKNQEKQRVFDEITSRENLGSFTGLSGEELEMFHAYYLQYMKCNLECTELELYSEIYRILNEFSVR